MHLSSMSAMLETRALMLVWEWTIEGARLCPGQARTPKHGRPGGERHTDTYLSVSVTAGLQLQGISFELSLWTIGHFHTPYCRTATLQEGFQSSV
jgi:hypothetical protein